MDSSLYKKIGQMLVYGWHGSNPGESTTVSAKARKLIDEFYVGGIILMGRNTETPSQVRRLLREMQQRASEQGLPQLFVSIDQEGGEKGTRLGPPHFNTSQDAVTIGRTGAPEEARRAAYELGAELKDLGFNWNFAPVLDVNNNPKNPVIGDRSYGSDPALVAAMGVAATRGFQQDAGIMACGKHFPGHGDTDVDSHLALPIVPHGRARLNQIELVPFLAAIKAGIAGIMTSHILFSAVDDLPATLSKSILTDLLRRELGFEGVIVTDCLEMNGISSHWDIGEAAVLAVLAGADILLCCHTYARQLKIHQALIDAVQTGRITESRLDESLGRIAVAKAQWVQTSQLHVRELDPVR